MAVFITVWLLWRIKNKPTLKQKVFGNISVTLFAVLNTEIVVVFVHVSLKFLVCFDCQSSFCKV